MDELIVKEDLINIYNQIALYNGHYVVLEKDLEFIQDDKSYTFIKGTLAYVYCTIDDIYTYNQTVNDSFHKALYNIKIKVLYNNTLDKYIVWTKDRQIRSRADAAMSCMKGLDFLRTTFRRDAYIDKLGLKLDDYWDSKDDVVKIKVNTNNKLLDSQIVKDFNTALDRRYDNLKPQTIKKTVVYSIIVLSIVTIWSISMVNSLPSIIKVLSRGFALLISIGFILYVITKYLINNSLVSDEPLLAHWTKIQKQIYIDTYKSTTLPIKIE